MLGDDEYLCVVIQERKVRHSIEHWLNKVITVQQTEEVLKAPAATDIDKVDVVGQDNKGGDRLVLLSEVKVMTDQALEESRKKRDHQVTELTENTIIDVLEMCAVEGRHGDVRFIVFLAIISVTGDVLDEGKIAAQAREVAARAVVHPVMIQAVTKVLLNED